jgi:hypothetical protein
MSTEEVSAESVKLAKCHSGSAWQPIKNSEAQARSRANNRNSHRAYGAEDIGFAAVGT